MTRRGERRKAVKQAEGWREVESPGGIHIYGRGGKESIKQSEKKRGERKKKVRQAKGWWEVKSSG